MSPTIRKCGQYKQTRLALFKLWLITCDSYLAYKSIKHVTTLTTKQKVNLNFPHLHKRVPKSRHCRWLRPSQQTTRRSLWRMCYSIFSIRPLLPHRYGKIYRFKRRVLAICTQFAAQNRRSPSRLSSLIRNSLVAQVSQSQSAYPERILMRILPANTELRNQNHGQLFPLEVLTGKSYQSTSYENTRQFSNNSDRPHSRLLPSSL